MKKTAKVLIFESKNVKNQKMNAERRNVKHNYFVILDLSNMKVISVSLVISL